MKIEMLVFTQEVGLMWIPASEELPPGVVIRFNGLEPYIVLQSTPLMCRPYDYEEMLSRFFYAQ